MSGFIVKINKKNEKFFLALELIKQYKILEMQIGYKILNCFKLKLNSKQNKILFRI